MENSGDLTAHLTTGAVIVYGIQWLKSSGWCPWLTADTKGLNRTLSAILAVVAAIGINWTYAADNGTLVVTGLTTSAMLSSGWEFLKQYVAQQVLYQSVLEPRPVKMVQ